MAVDITLERTLPHSVEAERAVLGAILVNNDAVHAALQTLRVEDFYREAHRKIYRAIENLAMGGSAIDLVTIREELTRSRDLETVGGMSYVAMLTDGMPSSGNIEHYLRIVRQKATLRQLIDAAGRILQEAYEAGEECDTIVENAEREIFRVANQTLRSGFVPMHVIAEIAMKHLEELEKRQELLTGLETGFQRLDELTSGLQKAELIVVAARPSMGKTAFVLNVAAHLALRRGVRVGVFSLEMSREQLLLRMLCAEGRVNMHLLRTGRLGKKGMAELMNTFGALAEAPIWIDDTPGVSLMELRSKAMRLKAEHGLDLLIVDYLQLMRGRGRYESRQQEISDISRSLKEIAKELDIPLIAVSQLSRAPETRGGDRRPQLSDLRESGAIEQDADVVLFIYRAEVYGRTEENAGMAEVLIRKQRNGPTGDLDLVFLQDFTLFANPEYRRE